MRSPGRRRPGRRWVLHPQKPVVLRARPADPVSGLVSNIPAVKYFKILGYLGAAVVKNPPANAEDAKRYWFNPWFRKIPWRRIWQPAPIFLPGKFHGQRNLAGYRACGCRKLNRTRATSSSIGGLQLWHGRSGTAF